MSLEASAPTKDRPIVSRESISFELLPTHERDHLDLDTGEVFQDYSYARLQKNEQKLIHADIAIHALPDESYYQYNVMHYLSERKSDDSYEPSSIHFEAYISPATFRELADNTRGGLFPETITIKLVDDPSRFFTTDVNLKNKPPLEFGWEPDGSGMIWHNTERENQRIAIESVGFEYAIAKPRYHDKETDHLLPMPFNSTTEQLNVQMSLVQTRLVEIVKYIRWAATGIVVLAIVFGILVVKQGVRF